jgi:predicted site-specific integrase-resolvase
MPESATTRDETTCSVNEFAAAVGVHPITVRRWIKRGLVEYTTSPTGRIKIPRAAVGSVFTVHAPAQAAA